MSIDDALSLLLVVDEGAHPRLTPSAATCRARQETRFVAEQNLRKVLGVRSPDKAANGLPLQR